MIADLSVVMPLHDAAAWVEDAIQSVLNGADGLLELLVVDDGSTDGGADVAVAFGDPVRVLRQPVNRGPAAARNRGIEAARGDLVGFLDADDLWAAGCPDPRRALLADADVDIALGVALPVAGPPGRQPVPVAWPAPEYQLGMMLARRTAFARFGLLDPALRYSEDLDWVLRAREQGVREARTGATVVLHRRREGSMTRDREASDRSVVHAIHASLTRRRTA